MDCKNQFQQLLMNVEGEQETGQKKRTIRSGEVLFQLVCTKVELRPGYLVPPSIPQCTQALPVRLHVSQSSLGTANQQLFLEASTRYVSFTSKKTPCPVQHLAPAVFETQAGRHIFWNGTHVERHNKWNETNKWNEQTSGTRHKWDGTNKWNETNKWRETNKWNGKQV